MVRNVVHQVRRADVATAIDEVVEMNDIRIDAKVFDELTTGPNYEALLDKIRDQIADFAAEVIVDEVSEYLTQNVED